MSRKLYPGTGGDTTKYYGTDAADIMTAGLPTWSPDRTDDTSETRIHANLIGIQRDELNEYAEHVFSKRLLPLVPPEKYPSDAFIAGEDEGMTDDDIITADGNIAISGIVSVSGGTITDASVPIYNVLDENTFLESPETDVYLFASGSLSVSGDIRGEYINGKIEAIANNEQQLTINLPYTLNPIVSINNTAVVVTPLDIELITAKEETAIVSAENRYHFLEELPISDISVNPVYVSGQNTYAGIDIIDRTNPEIDYIKKCDFNNNDIIDEDDVAAVTNRLGATIGNIGYDKWKAEYEKYDVNGDGKIDNVDFNIINSRLNAVAKKGVVVRFRNAGEYLLSYDTVGSQAMVGTIANVEGAVVQQRNVNTQYTSNILDADITDITYNNLTKVFYAANNTGKCITSYKMFNDEIVDRFDIPLGILANDIELRGICSYSNFVYLLLSYSNAFKIIRLDVTLTDPFAGLLEMDIYTGKDMYKKINRDPLPLTDPSGIFASDDFLFIVDGNQIFALARVYDYFYADREANILFCRELYDEIRINGSAYNQVYFYIWNVFDEYGYRVGVSRLPGESNHSYKRRLLTVYDRPHNADLQGSIDGIMRELDEDFQNITKQTTLWLQNEVVDVNRDNLKLYVEGVPVQYDSISIEYKKDLRQNNIYPYYVFKDIDDIEIFTLDYDTIVFPLHTAKDLFWDPDKREYDVMVKYKTQTATGTVVSAGASHTLEYNTLPPSGVLRANILTDPMFINDPDSGYYDEEGNPTAAMVEIIDELNSKHRVKWYNFTTDSDLMLKEGGASELAMVKPTTYDASGMHYQYSVNGVGDNESLSVVGAVKNELGDRIIYSDFIKEQSLYEDITLPYVDKLEQMHPIVQPGYLYDRHDPIYCYADKRTEIVTSGISYNHSGLPWHKYPLTKVPKNFSPILVCDDINTGGISGIFDKSLFYRNVIPSGIIHSSGNITVTQSELKGSSFEGTDRFNPSERFAQTYASGVPNKAMTVCVNDIYKMSDLDPSDNPHVYVKDDNYILSTISGMVKVEYESGGESFVASSLDINPITNEMNQLVLCISKEDHSPSNANIELTKQEVIGNEVDYSDIVVTTYNKDGIPVSGVMVSGWIDRNYVTEQTHNIYTSGVVERYDNGHFHNDIINLSTNPIVTKKIMTLNGNTLGEMRRGQRQYIIPSLGNIEGDSGVTGDNGTYVIRYRSPYNFQRSFDVDINIKISGIGRSTSTTVRVYPINKTGLDSSLVHDNIPNLRKVHEFVNIVGVSGSIALNDYPFGGPTSVIVYDAEDFFTYNRNTTASKPDEYTCGSGMFVHPDKFNEKYVVPTMTHVSGVNVSGISISGEIAGMVECQLSKPMTTGEYVMVYTVQDTDKDIVNMGDVITYE